MLPSVRKTGSYALADGQEMPLPAEIKDAFKTLVTANLVMPEKMDRAHMGKIDRGERNVILLNLLKIAVALRCRASEIMAAAGL